MLAEKQRKNGDFESFENREDSLREWVSTQPYKIIHADFGYYARLDYKKYLCRESIIALQIFIQEAIQLEEFTISSIVAAKKQKIFSKALASKNKRLGSNMKVSGGTVDDIYSKFGSIK